MTASSSAKRRFARIDRLPPYVFNITAELKLAARRRGEDIIDMSMGNPDGATPAHIVAKLTEVAQRPDTHGYSASKGIPRLRRAISTGTASATAWTSTPTPRRSSPSAPRKASPT
jgi:alanine-synthesizing transaminase